MKTKNLKHQKRIILATLLLGILGGCASANVLEDPNNESSAEEDQASEITSTAKGKTDSTTQTNIQSQKTRNLENDIADESSVIDDTQTESTQLRECYNLLGMIDEEAVTKLNGGRGNYANDHSTLEGRSYQVELFGDANNVETIYNDDGIIQQVTIYLQNGKMGEYREELESEFGAPGIDNGITAWSEGGKTIELKQLSGTICIQMTLDE